MNLRSLFHVPETAPQKQTRQRMPSVIDVDVDFVDEPAPRGRSVETWNRARGWASED